MSRATTEAWYNADRIGRLQLVAAYFVLNGLVPLGFALAVIGHVIRGIDTPPANELVFGLVMLFAIAGVSFYCAYLLWNARKAGAYWVIGLTVLSLLKWVTNPAYFLGDLMFGLIPAILVAMSWSALKSDDTVSIAPRSAR